MTPLFKTHFSIGRSILRIDDVDRICKDGNIEEIFLVEDTMAGFPEAFRTLGDRLRFGFRFSIYNEDLSEDSESKMIAFPNGDAKEWVAGTCFVFESNIYEVVVDAIKTLVEQNEDKNKYCFILDSVDGLISQQDIDKSFYDSNKVAGGAVIAANFMKRMSISLAKRGHMAIFISQVRADIKLDPYSKAPIRQTSATGGNALLHFANYIIEFEPRFKSDMILQDPTKKQPDPKTNPIIGHWAKATIKKSPNEKTNNTIPYPIRYGKTGGKSVWVEKELVDLLYMWEFVTKKGAWITIGEELKELVQDVVQDLPEKVQGEANLFKMVEENEALSEFLINYFKSNIGELV